MKWFYTLFILCCFMMISACSSNASISTTNTPQPTDTTEPIHTPQPTIRPTLKPSQTSEPDHYETLGYPISQECGNGIIRISSNDSFNGLFRADGFDQFHGHMDILVPEKCNYLEIKGEFLSPATGIISKYTFPEPDFGPNGIGFGYHLEIPPKTYIKGIENALIFSGIENPDISKVTNIVLDFGHIEVKEGYVTKGESIGEVVGDPGFPPENKFAWQIGFNYFGKEYMFTPTLFEVDGFEWKCASSLKNCEEKPNYYAKK